MRKLSATALLTLIAVIVFLAVILFLPRPAKADPRTDCPSPAPCKVITLSAEEEQALTGPKMLFDTAVQGRQLDMMGIASYFRQKLSIAPAGDAPKAAEKASDAAAQPSAAK